MARGTDFGGTHSLHDLNLIQQSVEITPAEPKLNLIDVPGADGSKDMSEQPSGRVVYKDRKITWTFALYPGEDWSAKHRQVSNALNGVRCQITLDDDPNYYYEGRVVVNKYNRDKTLRQITAYATCAPYMLKQQPTKVQLEELSTEYQTLILVNERMPVVPTITTTVDTTLSWNGSTFTVSAGVHKILDIELQEGKNELGVEAVSDTGSITVEYQEGSL